MFNKLEPMIFYFLVIIFCHPVSPTALQSGPWYPPNQTANQTIVFHTVSGDAIAGFQAQITEAINSVLTHGPEQRPTGELFQWITLTAFRESVKVNSDSWIVFGGAIPNPGSDLTHPFTKFATGVMSCRFTPQSDTPYGFVFQNCAPLDLQYVQAKNQRKEDEGAGLLGLGLSSIQLTGKFDGAVLVYCDPLWRGKGLHAAGRCRIRLRTGGQWWSNDTSNELIEFCTSSDHSQPCAGGFSVDLLQMHTMDPTDPRSQRVLPNVKMMVGLPFSQPTGEVQLIENALRRPRDVRSASSSVHRILGGREKFGSKVKWTPEMKLKTNRKRQLSFTELSETPDHTRFDQWTEESLALITSRVEDRVLAYRHLGSNQGEYLFDIKPKTEHISSFGSGFGHTVDTVIVPIAAGKSPTRSEYAIVVGSPFESNPLNGPNFGRVYIVCPQLTNITDELSFLDGSQSHAFFGYSVVRLGDVDGDGIDDVAIGAPALSEPTSSSKESQDQTNLVGKVYIHRVTAQCKLDPVPVQVLTAPDSEPGDGFGVGLARGIDVDSDGWPELFVTSLRPNKAPYVYTMPRRLRAQCHISIPPVSSLTPFSTGTKIPLTITVRLFDAHQNRWVEIPNGVASRESRLHQINPDVLWQQRQLDRINDSLAATPPDIINPPVDEADTFFTTIADGEMDPYKPRFSLVGNQVSSISMSADANKMYVRASLQALYGAETMDLSTIPLQVAYRSLLNASTCPTLHSDNLLCRKMQQPLIDWSACTGDIKLAQQICVPAPACEADLELKEHQEQEQLKPDPQLAPTQTIQSGEHGIPLIFGSSKDRQQIVQFRVTNRGPTKTTGIRIQLRVGGKIQSERPVGVRLSITHITVIPTGLNESSENGWSVIIAENGAAALISSTPQKWMYTMESILIQVTLFVEGLTESVPIVPNQWDLEMDKIRTSLQPVLTARVYSAANDPNMKNNEFRNPYNLTHKLHMVIGAGAQPSTVIDNRKAPSLIDPKSTVQKVFSREIGPKVDHTFLIENRGYTTLHNLTFALDLPVMTADGKPLLYLADQVRQRSNDGSSASTHWKSMLPQIVGADGQTRGECTVPEEHLNQFHLMILDFEPKTYRVKRSSATDPQETSTGNGVSIERLEDPEKEIETDFPFSSSPVSSSGYTHSGNSAFERTERGRIQLLCPPPIQGQQHQQQTSSNGLLNWPKCVEIRCHLTRLDNGDTVRVRWTGWLWAATYFQLHTPDVQLVSRLRLLDWGDPPETIKFYQHLASLQTTAFAIPTNLITIDKPRELPSFEMKQSVIFRNVQPDVIHQVPWWPIIVGVVVGCLLLSALGSCCYCCGFFRRRKIPGKEQNMGTHSGLTPHSASSDQLLPVQSSGRNRKRDVPSFLPTVRPRLDAKPVHLSRRHGKSRRKPMDETDFLVQASPNLLYAEEPEPPSPKIPITDYVAEAEWDPENEEMHENYRQNSSNAPDLVDLSQRSLQAHQTDHSESLSSSSDQCLSTENTNGLKNDSTSAI